MCCQCSQCDLTVVWAERAKSQADGRINDRETTATRSRPGSSLRLQAADSGLFVRMQEQVWASWFPRCLLLIISVHTSVSTDRDLRPCDEVSALYYSLVIPTIRRLHGAFMFIVDLSAEIKKKNT